MSALDEKALWRACEPMKEDGMAIANYLDQLSGLLFLKACSVSGKVSLEQFDDEDDIHLPEEYRWEAILNDSNNSLERYESAIDFLKNKDGNLSEAAFDGFTPQFTREATFSRTVELIEDIDGWEDYQNSSDLFGDAHEYLLEKYADKAEGAGEYFTPRPLIQAMVGIIDPDPSDTIIDPAAGTNGFLIHAYNYLQEKTNDFEGIEDAPVEQQFTSREIQTETYRLGLLNYLLHDLDPVRTNALRGNSLREEKNSEKEYDAVLANPPFGPKVSNKYDPRCDRSVETNFLVMMTELLNDDGKAAIVVPEGILFDSSKQVVRDELLDHFNLDCILALPEGTFEPYAGVDANVLFFERDPDGTDEFWFYDSRSNYENIKESNPLRYQTHFADFVNYYDNREEHDEYFKIERGEIDEENKELHLKKYKQYKYEGHRPPAEIAQDIKDELGTIENTLDQMVGDADD